MPRRTVLLAALTMSACSANSTESEAATSGITTIVDASGDAESTGLSVNTVTSATPSPTTSTNSSTSVATATTDDVFTTGTPPDFDTGGVGCGGKIDLLFVIDRGATMWNQQPALAASLPKFLQTIEAMFDDFDLHIMVVHADPLPWGMQECDEICADNEGQGCAPDGPADYPCWAFTDDEIGECDSTFGAGVTFPAGFGASNERCELTGGGRYITDQDSDLASAFTCITSVGTVNTFKAVAGYALQYIFAAEQLEPGGCNAGFVRDDALLVIVAITDSDGWGTPGTPEEWTAPVFAAKGGDENAVVYLGLTPDQAWADEPLCGGPYDGFPPHDELFTLFPNAVRASVCEADFSPFFDEAAALVETVCETFIPQ